MPNLRQGDRISTTFETKHRTIFLPSADPSSRVAAVSLHALSAVKAEPFQRQNPHPSPTLGRNKKDRIRPFVFFLSGVDVATPFICFSELSTLSRGRQSDSVFSLHKALGGEESKEAPRRRTERKEGRRQICRSFNASKLSGRRAGRAW